MILLFNSPAIHRKKDIFEMENNFPRIGVASIASCLLKEGFQVKIIEPQVFRESERIECVKREIREAQPEAVGIPAFTEEIYDSATIARLVKEVDPSIKNIAGGPHPSALPAETLNEFKWFDVVVVGEGEATMVEIMKGLPLEEVDGIAFRDGSEIRVNRPRRPVEDLDSLPPPAWELYNLDIYRGTVVSLGYGKRGGRILELPVEGARGCPFPCNFCFRISGQKMRFKSPKLIVDEIERNIKRFGAETTFFVEGTFGVDKKHGRAVCSEIIRRGIHKVIRWSTQSRVDTLDEELLEAMANAGCSYIGFGVESGDPGILKAVGKSIRPEQAVQVMKICRRLGIKAEANFILGHPYETVETVNRTIRLAASLDADEANFAIMVPFPGTEVYRMALNRVGGLSIATKDWSLYGKQLGEALRHDFIPTETLIRLQARAYATFYLRPRRILNFLRKINIRRSIHSVSRLLPTSNRGL